jgi:hypothetical protein
MTRNMSSSHFADFSTLTSPSGQYREVKYVRIIFLLILLPHCMNSVAVPTVWSPTMAHAQSAVKSTKDLLNATPKMYQLGLWDFF